jgi:supervillin
MTTLYGKFEVKEILNPLRTENVCPFPFFQFHLYEEKQPSLFLIDCESEIFVWQGWFESSTLMPDTKSKIVLNEIDATDGSSKIRFTLNRKAALQTAINYWNTKNSNKEFKGFVVYAGLEPVEFTNLFPLWEINEKARDSNLNVWIYIFISYFYFQKKIKFSNLTKEGKSLNQKDNIIDILAQLSRNRYPASVLRERPLPDGVNPLCLTDYLCDEEFKVIIFYRNVAIEFFVIIFCGKRKFCIVQKISLLRFRLGNKRI